ncbi:MAG: hypothetical protein Q4E91_00005, partial [Lachnospiraceae bacterium]|nr:hypothetical protein [Lachnospiraceae bacterium]
EAPAEAVTETEDDPLIEETDAPVTETEEPVTETASETEGKKDTFTYSGNGLKATIKLEAKNALPESAQVTVKELTAKSDSDRWEKAVKQIRKKTDQGHRELAKAHIYQLAFLVDGNPVKPEGKITVKLEFADGLALGLEEYAQGEAAAFVLGDSGAEKAGSPKLNASRKIAGAEISAKGLTLMGIAGIQNRENDGETITRSGLEEGLGDALDYAAVARDYSGKEEEHVAAANLQKIADDADSQEEAPDIDRILEKISDYSLILANGKSSSQVKIVNLYADEKGRIDDEPLQQVLSDNRIDVSDAVVVVNVVADSKDQSLKLPVYPAEYQKDAVQGSEEKESYAGRVVYNIVAEKESGYTEYTGDASLEGYGIGTYLAADGELNAADGVLGAVYADEINTSRIKMAVVGQDGVTQIRESESKPAEETEAAPETVSEESEPETEPVTEAVTEAGESESEPAEETEAAPETVSEESEPETEPVTEAVTEAAESESEPAGETEAATETVSEESEPETELVTEAVTEAAESENETAEETEAASETVSEAAEGESETAGETETETEDSLLEEETETEAEAVLAEGLETEEEIKQLAPVKAFAVAKLTSEGAPVEGAGLVVQAAQSVVPAANVTVRNQAGEEVTFEAGKVAYKMGAEIYRWTTTADAAGVDISPYLISGGSYVIREISAPEGYTTGPDMAFTVNDKGEAIGTDGEVITGLQMTDDPVTADMLILKLAVVDKAAPGTYLAGAGFVIKAEDGTVLTDGAGNPYTFLSAEGETVLSLDPELYGALTEGLENGSERSFRLVETSAASGYQIADYSEVGITIAKDENGMLTLIPEEKYTENGAVIFRNTKVDRNAGGTISLTKRNYYNFSGDQIYAQNGATYYAALFSDKDKTVRISDVRAIEIRKGYKAATIKFANLPDGTYYVGETDAYGNLVGTVRDSQAASDPFYALYQHNGKEEDKVVIKTDDAGLGTDTETVAINNQYFELPDNFSYTASFTVTKEVKNTDGSALASSSTFYAGIYTKNTKSGSYRYAGKKAIKMGGQSSKTVTVELPMSADTKYVLVKEVDANGNEVRSGESYTVNVSPSEFVLQRGSEQNVVITNTKVASTEPQTETEPGIGDGKAELKLTKKVLYKNTPIRINSVYYIGIFDDEELTKLRYKKAMTLSNASELTATLKVNLNKVPGKEVTFYFAEVDEEGKVLTGGNEFGYDISLNKTSVTLNSRNMSDEVIVTNSVIAGGSIASQLADPTSGLAGDSAALATAQNLATSENADTKTGDSTPIIPLVIVLVVCAVVIVLVILLKKRRR